MGFVAIWSLSRHNIERNIIQFNKIFFVVVQFALSGPLCSPPSPCPLPYILLPGRAASLSRSSQLRQTLGVCPAAQHWTGHSGGKRGRRFGESQGSHGNCCPATVLSVMCSYCLVSIFNRPGVARVVLQTPSSFSIYCHRFGTKLFNCRENS